MGRSHDIARGASTMYQTQAASDTRFVNTAGDTMTGDLGIGVAPAQPLHVFKAGSQGGGMAPLIKVQNDTNNLTGDGSGIEFHGKYQGGEWGFGKIGGTNAGANFGGSLEFHTNTGTGSVSTGFTKKMTIDHNGYVTNPLQPAFNAKSTNAIAISGSVTLTFNEVRSNASNSYNSSNGTFTAPVAGQYIFTHKALYYNFNTNEYLDFYTYVNSSVRNQYEQTGNAGGHTQVNYAEVVYLNANDTFKIVCNNRNVGAYNMYAQENHFSGRLLG